MEVMAVFAGLRFRFGKRAGMELERGKGFSPSPFIWSDSAVRTAQNCADGRVVKDLLF